MIDKILKPIAKLVLKKDINDFTALVLTAHQKYTREYGNTISPYLTKFLIIGEDHRFYSHSGVDIISVIRAIIHKIFLLKKGGASTINMQLVRVLTNKYEHSISRKIKEMLFAELLEDIMSKDEIPGLYLSIAYFGWKMNGLKQACDRLKYDFRNMTPNNSASLIARLKYPEPKVFNTKRSFQITRRQSYLMFLYNKYFKFMIKKNPIKRKAYGTF
jgi:penicillin-binding protein 1A